MAFHTIDSDKGAELGRHLNSSTMKNDIIDRISMTTEYVASKDENNLSNYSSTNNPLPALKLMSISQVAKSLRLGRDTVKSLINQGKIGVLQIGKRSRIPLAEIERFISTETQKTVSVNEEPLISKRDLDMFFGRKKKCATPRGGAEIWTELVGEC